MLNEAIGDAVVIVLAGIIGFLCGGKCVALQLVGIVRRGVRDGRSPEQILAYLENGRDKA